MLLSADEEQMAGYVYDAGGIRTHKASGTVVYSTVNGYPNSFATVSAFTLYPSELITVSSGMYTKHYYNGSSRIASRIGGGFNQHNDLNSYSPLTDHVQLQNSNDYTNKAQQLRNVWSRNASCAGLDQNLEYAYSFDVSYRFTNPQPDGERYFYHSDHLGSSAYITTEMRSIREDLWKTTWTEQNGYATQFLAYMPFGETLSEQQNSTSYYSPFKFSAKEKDPETGYSYFGARYYSPELSVWLGVDPMSDERPSLSAYNYCQWNPVMRIDPRGMLDGWIDDGNGTVFWDENTNSQEEFNANYAGQSGYSYVSDSDNPNAYTLPNGEGKLLLNSWKEFSIEERVGPLIEMEFIPSDNSSSCGWLQTYSSNIPDVDTYTIGIKIPGSSMENRFDFQTLGERNPRVLSDMPSRSYNEGATTSVLWSAQSSVLINGNRSVTVEWGFTLDSRSSGSYTSPRIISNPSAFHIDAINSVK